MADNLFLMLNVNAMDSEWLHPLPAGARLAWVMVLIYVKTNGRSGRVKAKSASVFAQQHNILKEDVETLLCAAREDRALVDEDGVWELTNWSKYQNNDPTRNERVARHRLEKKAKAEAEQASAEQVTDVTRYVTPEESKAEQSKVDFPNGKGESALAQITDSILNLLPAKYTGPEIGTALTRYNELRERKIASRAKGFRRWETEQIQAMADKWQRSSPEAVRLAIVASTERATAGVIDPAEFMPGGKNDPRRSAAGKGVQVWGGDEAPLF